MNKKPLDKGLIKQIELEKEIWETSLQNYDMKLSKMIENKSIQESKEVIIIIKATIDALTDYIIKYYEYPFRGYNRKVRDYLHDVFGSADNLAYVLLKTLFAEVIGQTDLKVLQLSRAIVSALKVYEQVHRFKETEPKLYNYIEYNYKHLGEHIVRQKKKRVARINFRGSSERKFNHLLGTTCIDLVIKSGCNLLVRRQGRDGTIYIDLSDETKALFLRSKVFFGTVTSAFLPLIYKPKPWKSLVGSGGYYTLNNINFIKVRSKKDLIFIKKQKPDLSRLYNVINTIQETPYRINKRVLDVVDTIIKHNLVNPNTTKYNPALYGDIPYMGTISTKELICKSDYGKIDSDGKFINKEDKNKWLKALERQDINIRRIESKRLAYKLAVNIAHRFKDREKIYFSYQVDFRGRLYPIQKYLNPQLSSNIKPLLEFYRGSPLTPEGLKWLKISGANHYGYDKLTYDERIQKIEEKTEEIKLVHQDPIANLKYWYDADEPLEYLSFCFAYGDYLQDPSTPIHYTVALDATCSGIQIYSGALKDKEGAIAVNVINNPTNTVSDIYKEVADVVNDMLEKGDYPKEFIFNKDNPKKDTKTVPTTQEALSLRGRINRKITKRNVMTQPYSVTLRGMTDQLFELFDEYEREGNVFWEGDKWVISHLLATLNSKAIHKVVKGAKEGQKILKDILHEHLEDSDYAFWYSPIFKFPILQRITREKRQRLYTPLGKLVLYHPTDKVHYLRMLNGIAPNWVHSLDATLLYRTMERCIEKGVKDFWLIHDSYGVSPNDVEILNTEVREAYIELFSANPLLDFAKQLKPDMVDDVEKVMINTLDLEEVRDSKYIFS